MIAGEAKNIIPHGALESQAVGTALISKGVADGIAAVRDYDNKMDKKKKKATKKELQDDKNLHNLRKYKLEKVLSPPPAPPAPLDPKGKEKAKEVETGTSLDSKGHPKENGEVFKGEAVDAQGRKNILEHHDAMHASLLAIKKGNPVAPAPKQDEAAKHAEQEGRKNDAKYGEKQTEAEKKHKDAEQEKSNNKIKQGDKAEIHKHVDTASNLQNFKLKHVDDGKKGYLKKEKQVPGRLDAMEAKAKKTKKATEKAKDAEAATMKSLEEGNNHNNAKYPPQHGAAAASGSQHVDAKGEQKKRNPKPKTKEKKKGGKIL